MAEKLLLHIHYECARHKVQLPWDAIAHRLHPGSSGAAVLQHVNRLRKELITEGHMVPPVAQKPTSGVQIDSSIRGYVRQDPIGDDRETTRPVRFDEKMDDPKFNLPDAFTIDDDEEQQSTNSDDEEVEAPDTPTPVHQRRRRTLSSNPPNSTRPTSQLRQEERHSSEEQSNCGETEQQNFTLGHAVSNLTSTIHLEVTNILQSDQSNSPVYETPRLDNVYPPYQGVDSSPNHSFDERGPFDPMAALPPPPASRVYGPPPTKHMESNGMPDYREYYPFQGYPHPPYPQYEGAPMQKMHPAMYGMGHPGFVGYGMGYPIPPHYHAAYAKYHGIATGTVQETGSPVRDTKAEATSPIDPQIDDLIASVSASPTPLAPHGLQSSNTPVGEEVVNPELSSV